MAVGVKANFNQNSAWSGGRGKGGGCLCDGMWHAEWTVWAYAGGVARGLPTRTLGTDFYF